MRRTVRLTLLILVLAAAGAWGYDVWKNPERETLGTAAREGVPGRFVTLTDGVTHFDVSGPDSGRVVVLVHGFSVPYYIWDSTFTRLSAAGYRVITYDLFGRGWSDRPDAAYDGPMYDRQISDLLDSLKVTQAVDLVGLSFGGFVAAHYASGHPPRVRSLTLVDPVSTSSKLPGFLSIPVLGPWFWQISQIPGKAESQSSDFLHPERYPDWADKYRPQMRYKGFGRALLRSALTVSRTGFDTLFAGAAKADLPVLLVWGKQDRTVAIELSSVVRENIPSVDFFPVDSAGHLPHIEQAAIVHEKLQQFFRAHPSRVLAVP